MPPCSFYKQQGFSYSVSVHDSSQCFNYVRLNQAHYNVQGFSVSLLRKIAAQHSKLEAELEEAEEEQERVAAQVRRLQKMKKQWAEKMTWAVACGFDSMEELERVEEQERLVAAPGPGISGAPGRVDWSVVFRDSPLLFLDASIPAVVLEPSGNTAGVGPNNV